MRRREFIHEGLRWLDIKRFALKVTHKVYNQPDNVLEGKTIYANSTAVTCNYWSREPTLTPKKNEKIKFYKKNNCALLSYLP
jgi:hypothetical protein